MRVVMMDGHPHPRAKIDRVRLTVYRKRINRKVAGRDLARAMEPRPLPLRQMVTRWDLDASLDQLAQSWPICQRKLNKDKNSMAMNRVELA